MTRLSVPAADDERSRSPGCSLPGTSSGTATCTRGRSAGRLARRLMSLSHRLFGIRSCNEVIDGRRGRPCLEYDIKRCLAPCVESICSQASSPARSGRAAVSRRADRRAGRHAQQRTAEAVGRGTVRGGGTSARRGAAIRALGTGSRRWPRPGLATATCSASSSGRLAPRSRSSRSVAAASSSAWSVCRRRRGTD